MSTDDRKVSEHSIDEVGVVKHPANHLVGCGFAIERFDDLMERRIANVRNYISVVAHSIACDGDQTVAGQELESQPVPDATCLLGGVDESGSNVCTIDLDTGILVDRDATVESVRQFAYGVMADLLDCSNVDPSLGSDSLTLPEA